MIRRNWIVAIICISMATLLACVAWFLYPREKLSPQLINQNIPQDFENMNTEVPKPQDVTTNSEKNFVYDLVPIIGGDKINSWNFKGAYSDNSEFVEKATQEIRRLSGLIDEDGYSNMNLYIGIANQYDLLGDGRQEYDYISRAIKVGGETTGLPWHNLGVLMERLGALKTAEYAYKKATIVQPQFSQYQYAYSEFLKRHE